MPTISILKQFIVDDVEQFANAIESSFNDSKVIPKDYSITYLTDPKQIKAFMNKRNEQFKKED